MCPLEESSFMFALSKLWFIVSKSYHITANFDVRLHVGNICYNGLLCCVTHFVRVSGFVLLCFE